MKECKECGIAKDKSSFYGVQGECKECTKARVKVNSKRVGNAYDFSEIGVIRVIYKTQKRNNKLRWHGDLPYTKAELSEWMYSNGFKALFDEWLSSEYSKNLKPSVDRIDDLTGYMFENIRLCTWLDNKKHQYDDIKNGVGTGGLRCKRLYKFDCNKSLICEYVSYSSAMREIGYSIEYQIKKEVKCRGGFYWSYCDVI